jgi:hypothetical protein
MSSVLGQNEKEKSEAKTFFINKIRNQLKKESSSVSQNRTTNSSINGIMRFKDNTPPTKLKSKAIERSVTKKVKLKTVSTTLSVLLAPINVFKHKKIKVLKFFALCTRQKNVHVKVFAPFLHLKKRRLQTSFQRFHTYIHASTCHKGLQKR